MDSSDGKNTECFWQQKTLQEMTEEEWESLCDGCGLCCFEKMIEGHGRRQKILFTRIACNLLDLKTYRCSNYCRRFEIVPECIKLTVKKLRKFDWLPETCAYRLLCEGKPLPSWHPLVSGNSTSVDKAGIRIKNAVHSKEAGYWEDYIIEY